MRLDAITVCVGYSGYLKNGLDSWLDGLDSLTIVTDLKDTATEELAKQYGVRLFRTDAFTRSGGILNKGWSIAECYAATAPEDWVLFFDADIVPRAGWRKKLEAANPQSGNLYGCRRHDETGRLMRDDPVAGFFQLFHSQDPLAKVVPIVDTHWTHCGNYDSTFMLRWRNEGRLGADLPLYLTHLGTPGENWMGIGNAEKVREMQRQRQRLGGGWKSVEPEKIKV